MPNTRARMLARCLSAALAVSACHAYDETLVQTAQHSQRRSPRSDAGEHADSGDASSAEVDASSAPIDEPTVDAGLQGDAAVSDRDAAPDDRGTEDTPRAGAGGTAGAAGSGGASSGPPAMPTDSQGAAGAAPTAPPAAVCTDASGQVWHMNGHCYFPLSVMNSWYVSRDRCRELSAHLVSITSKEEQTFVSALVGAAPRWIGLSRFGAPQFSWVDGESMTYENWEEGAPKLVNEAAVALRNETFRWFDDAVTTSYGAVCEREVPQPAAQSKN
jgi:Lectin C-type domain